MIPLLLHLEGDKIEILFHIQKEIADELRSKAKQNKNPAQNIGYHVYSPEAGSS